MHGGKKHRLLSEDKKHLPISYTIETKKHVSIVGCTARKQRLLSEVWKTTSDKLYYRNKKYVPIIGCTAVKNTAFYRKIKSNFR